MLQLNNGSTVTVNGSVGIGTTSPSYKLHVTGGRTLLDKLQYTRAIDVSSADLDSLTTAGFYDGSSFTNAPYYGEAGSGYYYITVERYSSDANWVHQTATAFGSGNTANITYSRVRIASNWSPWKILIGTDTDAGKYNYLPKFTTGTGATLGTSSIYDNGTNVGIGTTAPGSYKLNVVGGPTSLDQLQYTRAIDKSSTDLNLLTDAGFYNGNGCTNAPTVGWFYITVERYSGENTWVHQTSTSFGLPAGNINENVTYSRVRNGSTALWSAWKELMSTSGNTTNITGSVSITGSLSVDGAISNNVRTVATVYATGFGGLPPLLTSTDFMVFLTNMGPTIGQSNGIQLPSAVLNKGRIIYLQVKENIFFYNNITIMSVAGNINGTSTYAMPNTLYGKKMFVSDGSNWFVEPA